MDCDCRSVIDRSLQVVTKLRWLREPRLFRAWVFRIASRVAFALARKRRRFVDMMDVEIVDPSTDVLADSDAKLEAWVARIPTWLKRLTLKGREVLSLH